MKILIRIRAIFPIIILLSIISLQCKTSQKVNPNFSQEEFNKMADEVSQGSVPDISVKLLKKEKESFVILDCREIDEFNISHIEGARRVGFDKFDLSQITDISKDSKIVTYCTVGWRSEKIGEKLQGAGYLNVSNLSGSLLSWMNDGNPVIDGQGKKTNKIHGYNKKFEFEKHCKRGEMIY